MTTFYKEGDKLVFNGFTCKILHITETYRKNVLSVQVLSHPRDFPKDQAKYASFRLFETRDGTLELMNYDFE